MASRPAVKVYRKSAIPGVSITQFVDRIPAGCSTPDFERKPVTLSLQEGKNAIFRAVVKGVPTPEVKWKRAKGGMDDPSRYQTYFNPATNEFILQINKLTANDTDLYRCFAVNEYGEAVCSAGLRIIQVGFKRKSQQVQGPSADELKKQLKDYRKMLRKRAPQSQAKQVDKEAVWQLLLHADKKDYERICIKYGISDFRGMLKKLQEIRRDTEIAHGELIHSIKNQQHIRVTKDGKAVLSLEMELKNSNSKIYLLKDGEKLRYGTGDEYRKHCLKQVGKRYTFIVNDVHPEDAGLYQVRVENVPVFSTELDAEDIPVRFQKPLSDMRCHEEEDAVFECTLLTPCSDAVWLHKTHLLEQSEKHQISVSPDGLTHKLIIKNAEPSDSGLYTLDTGNCASNAWLIVEYAKGKRRQNEEEETDETGRLKGPLPDRAKKLRQGEYLGDQDHLMDISTKDGLYRHGRGGSQGHSIDDDGGYGLLGQEGLHGAHGNGRMGLRHISEAEIIDGESMSDGGSSGRLVHLRDTSGTGAFHGQDSSRGKASIGDGLEGAGGLHPMDGRGDARAGFKSPEGSDTLHGAVLEDTGAGAGGRIGEAGKEKFPYGSETSLSGKGGMGSLYQGGMVGTSDSSSAGVGGMRSLSDKDSSLGGASPGAGQRAEEIMGSFHDTGSGSRGVGGWDSRDGKGGILDDARGEGFWHDKGLYGEASPGTAVGKDAIGTEIAGGKGSLYGKNDLRVGASGPAGQEGRTGLLYGPDGLPTGLDAGDATASKLGGFYGKHGHSGESGAGDGSWPGADVASKGGMSPYGKDGLPAGVGVGGAGVEGTGGFGSPYGKDGLPAGADVGTLGGVGSPYGKDGLPVGMGAGAGGGAGVGGFGSPYGKDGLPVGAGVAGLGGAGSPYGKDGLPLGMGTGVSGAGDGFGGVGSPYGKDGLPVGAGVAGLGGAGSPYGKDGLPTGAGVAGLGGVGSPYGKDGLPVGAGVAGLGGVGSPYGKDGLPVGAGVAGLGGAGSPYGKDGLPTGAGVAGLGGVGSPYGKDGLPTGAGVAGLGGVGSPYGKDGLPTGAGVAGLGGVGSPCGKDGLPAGAGVAGLGGAGSPYGKDGLPAGAGVAGLGGAGSPYGKDGLPTGAGVAGLGGVGSPYGKDGLPTGAGVAGLGGVGSPYGKDGLPAGAGVAGLGGVGSPYGKDGLPAGAGVAGLGGVGSPYGKDGLPTGAGVAGLGGVGSPYGKDGLPTGAGVAGLGGVGSPYGKDGLPMGMVSGSGASGADVTGAGGVGASPGKGGPLAGIGLADGEGIVGAGGVGTPHRKDGLPVGTGAGIDVLGGLGSPYGKDGLPAGAGVGGSAGAGIRDGAGVDGLGGVGSLHGKDGLPAGAGIGGAGVDGLGGVGSLHGKDGLPAGAGIGGAGVGSLHGKDGLPAGAGIGGAGVDGLGGVGSPYGKDGLPAGIGGAAAAHLPFGGEDVTGSYHSKEAILSKTQGYLGGAGGAAHGKSSLEDGSLSASATQVAASPYGKDSALTGSSAGAGSLDRLGIDERELLSVRGREGGVDALGLSRQSGLDSRPGKLSAQDEAGTRAHGDIRGSGHKGSTNDRDLLPRQGSARLEDKDSGKLDSYYGKDSAFGGAGSKYYKRYPDARKLGVLGSLGYDQMAGLDGVLASVNRRIPDLELKAKDYSMNLDSTEKRRRFPQDGLRAQLCRVNKPLVDVRVVKGEQAELSCTVSSKDVQGTWFKDGLKIKTMEGVRLEKQGSVHKLIIDKVEDFHAGKYRFETADIKTEASVFVEDPPQVDKILLTNLTNVPTVTKAGQKVKIKIPFEGQLPIKATWLKDGVELIDGTRIRVDKADTFTMLSISSSERKDCGDYKVRLKNDHGALEMNLKLVVIDKPQPPTGPIKIIESSSSNITIQWKPPKDDGGKPLQSYIIQMQQVGKSDWVTLGETPKTCTTFTTDKVEQNVGYYFRVQAVNAEGAGEALESDEVKAASKAIPGPPDPPEIVSTGKETITISWKVPHKTGSSRIVGYMVQKRKKGASTWVPVTNMPVADRKLKMTNLKMGLQYEFRVAAVNAAGIGEVSAPSRPAFARDSTEPPGQVRDFRVAGRDSTSITLTWKTPEPKRGVDVKGYEVDMRSYDNLNWTKCSVLPIKATTYTVKGLQPKEVYFLRVRAVNDGGPGEAAELETFIEAPPPVVPPRFLINDRVKSFLVVKAGNTIRVPMRFEASPDPVVTWLKDRHPLPKRAVINTEHGTTQLLIEAAEFSDTGTYTVELQNGSGNKESFSFQIRVTDIPQSPGPVVLEENVPKTVTVTWEPSASEKWESDLYYTVLKRESQKGLWHTVGDMIYTNKFTYTKLVPGRDYYFRVVAKNCLGTSGPSETVQPWRVQKRKADFYIRQQEYRGVNHNQPPRFLVQLKPCVVTIGTECHMNCAVTGYPQPKITWYKDGKDLSKDPTYLRKNVFGVCSLMILGVVKTDEGEYMVEASNDLGHAFSKASLTIKASSL